MHHRANIGVLVACLTLLTCAVGGHANDVAPTPVVAPIETIGLFKNGLAVVRRSVTLPAGEHSRFDITELPDPVHGTFWIESNADVTVTMTTADLPIDESQRELPAVNNGSLAGAQVTVYFKHDGLPKVKGTVVAPPSASRQWNRDYGYSRPRQTYWWSGWSNAGANRVVPEPTAQSLVLEHEGGQLLIDPQSVAFVHVDEPPAQRTERRPVMRIAVDNAADDVQLGILYLTKGASWAPSYSVDITNSSVLTLRQKAVIRNELEDVDDAEFLLISGFPSIEFGHVLSPMSPASDLASFFQALGTENRLSHSSRGDVMGQTVMTNMAISGPGSEAAITNPSLTGDDLHYHSVGRHTLNVGDTLMINTGRATTEYERIVRWTMPDDRDKWGRRRAAVHSYNTGESMEDSDPWDALRFDNPFNRPTTTAPAMIAKDGMVRGQGMLYWTSPGESIVLDVNKALSVRASADEVEVEDERQAVTRYGVKYRRSTVQGSLTVLNQRAEPVTFVARVEFSGELLEAQGDPSVELRPEGVWSINPRRQMTWTLELEPGERRELEYTYHVYIRN